VPDEGILDFHQGLRFMETISNLFFWGGGVVLQDPHLEGRSLRIQ